MGPSLALALLLSAGAAEKPVTLAAPGLAGLNVDPEAAAFFSDHFAQQLTVAGVRVISATEVATLLGFERQKQLMGCSDDSQCVIELGGALDVDGIVTGRIGKFGGRYRVNVKVLSSRDGTALSVYSTEADNDEHLLTQLADGAREVAASVLTSLGRKAARVSKGAVKEAQALPKNVVGIPPGALLSLLVGALYAGIEYERVLLPHLSVWVTPYTQYETIPATDTAPAMDSFVLGVGLGVRYYPAAVAPKGFFVNAGVWGAPSLETRYVPRPPPDEAIIDEVDTEGWRVAPELMIGYTFLHGNWFATSLGIGAMYGIGPFRPGWAGAGRLNLGFAF